MVECRYSASSGTHKSLISVGVMVKTPSSSLPSTLTNYGLYSVHLRIAKGKMVLIPNWLTCNRAKCLVTLLDFEFNARFPIPQTKTTRATIPASVCPCGCSWAPHSTLRCFCIVQAQKLCFLWTIVSRTLALQGMRWCWFMKGKKGLSPPPPQIDLTV